MELPSLWIRHSFACGSVAAVWTVFRYSIWFASSENWLIIRLRKCSLRPSIILPVFVFHISGISSLMPLLLGFSVMLELHISVLRDVFALCRAYCQVNSPSCSCLEFVVCSTSHRLDPTVNFELRRRKGTEVEQAANLSATTKDCLFDKARYGTTIHHASLQPCLIGCRLGPDLL